MAEGTGLRSFTDEQLAQALADRGTGSEATLNRALRASKSAGTPLELTILELGLISEDALLQDLAEWLGVTYLKPADIERRFVRSSGLDLEFLERVGVCPAFENDDGTVTVATSDLRASDALAGVAFHMGQKFRPAICSTSTLRQVFSELKAPQELPQSQGEERDLDRLRALSNDGPAVAKVARLIQDAVSARASDVHIEAGEASGRIRFRVDGVLRTMEEVSVVEAQMLVARLKVLAELNVSEVRLPQDGRTQLAALGRNIDVRLSTLPTQYGESLVARLLDRVAHNLEWDSLGFSKQERDQIREVVSQANGLFLVAGPTGSGKTTTLYTALTDLATDEKKVITVEDPIEFSIPGVTQVQVRPELGMSFAKTLRAILRQDPDVVFIGEIRDEETAQIAVRAALIGRLVLATVHTNDSLSAIDRLLNLKVPSFLLAATLRGVLSQRLVRTVCIECKGSGCDACDHTGWKGRSVVAEMLQVRQDDSVDLANAKSSLDIPQNSRIRGYPSMAQAAQNLLLSGRTTEQELLRLDLLQR